MALALIKKTALALLISSLAACSTAPEVDLGEGAQSQELSGVDTAPGLDGDISDRKKVVISGVNADGIASVEIGNGQEFAGSFENGSPMIPDDVNAEMQPVIYFGYDQYALSDEAMQRVQHYSQIVLQNPNLKVILEGHTDERGTPEYNLALGERRAKAVQDAMITLGVEASRIQANSYGEEYPVAFDKNESAWTLNRRVEINLR